VSTSSHGLQPKTYKRLDIMFLDPTKPMLDHALGKKAILDNHGVDGKDQPGAIEP